VLFRTDARRAATDDRAVPPAPLVANLEGTWLRAGRTVGRSRRAVMLGAVLAGAAVLLARPLLQEYRHYRYSATIERVRNNLYLIQATDMNVAALVTDDGVVIVDTMPTGWWGQAVLDQLRTVTDRPITTIINTHSHDDHIGNAELFSPTMVDVVMHENARFQIQHAQVAGEDTPRVASANTFADQFSLTRGSDRIDLYYFGAAHTSGDAWVVFTSLGVMHIGDLVWRNDAPSFDRTAGGSGVAYPETLARGLAATRGVDTIIVGHRRDAARPVISRQDLEGYQRFGARLLADARTGMGAGRTATETATSLSARADAASYTPARVFAAVEAIYDELATPPPVSTTAGRRGAPPCQERATPAAPMRASILGAAVSPPCPSAP